jgi:hypothetical protein
MHFSLRNQLQESFSNAALPPEEPKPVVADVESGFKTVFEGKPEGEPLIPTEQVVQKGCDPKKDDEHEEMSEEDKKKKAPMKKDEPRFAACGFDLSPLPEATPVKKFNPHHGKDGRFTTAAGASGGEGEWASFNRFELQMSKDQSDSASGPGRADAAVQSLLQDDNIRSQLDKIDPKKIRDELHEYGAWDDKELADDAANRARIVWIAAGNIREERTMRGQ